MVLVLCYHESMATIDNALTTVARYKSFAEITGSSKDTLISMLIIGVSGEVERWCKRKFKRQTYTNEVYDGTGTANLYLKNTPIVAGQTLTLQRRTSVLNEDEWEDVDTELYYIDHEAGRIVMPTEFAEGKQNYRVTYTAGYYLPSNAAYQDGTDDDQDLPSDLEMAVLLLVNFFFNRRKSQGVASQRVRDVSVTYMKQIESDPEVKAVLSQHRRISYR